MHTNLFTLGKVTHTPHSWERVRDRMKRRGRERREGEEEGETERQRKTEAEKGTKKEGQRDRQTEAKSGKQAKRGREKWDTGHSEDSELAAPPDLVLSEEEGQQHQKSTVIFRKDEVSRKTLVRSHMDSEC